MFELQETKSASTWLGFKIDYTLSALGFLANRPHRIVTIGASKHQQLQKRDTNLSPIMVCYSATFSMSSEKQY